jgi:protoporphyrinogen/coproporphyrinogen III oxidase
VTDVPSGAGVVVVGGGVAGLTTAYRLLERGANVHVLEASDRVGGRLMTVPVGDLRLDAGADSFVARKPWAVALCEELGIELVAPRASGAAVYTDRGLVDLPRSALGVPAEGSAIARWEGLSRAGRVRALGDLVRKAAPPDGDESLGSLLRRRVGDEATEALVAPLLAGLFAGDIDRLGVSATFPDLAIWERRFGSLIRGANAALDASTSAGPMFLKPHGGVEELPHALADRISSDRISRGISVAAVERSGEAFTVIASDGAHDTDVVVVATPARPAATILEPLAPETSALLRELRVVSTGVVLLVYGEGTGDALPDATGFVVPRERAPMTAVTWLSRKWPDAAFGTRAVVRCFVGADGSEDVLDAGDDEIVEAVTRHLSAVTSLPAEPEHSAVVRWPGAMPQYDVGHLERVERIETSLPPSIFVAGNAYRGVGVADTVRGANDIAEAVHAHLAGANERTERVR